MEASKTMPETGKQSDRVALVTGGARRLGRAISLAFANAGYGVAIHCNKSVAEAEALADEINRRHAATAPRAWVVRGDLAIPSECDAVIGRAIESVGRLDVLVNNAASFALVSLADSRPEDFESQYKLNALAPALLSRKFSEYVLSAANSESARTHRAIVNIIDQRIAHPRANCIPYEMSKIALEGFTRAAAVELAPLITVNAVAPGAVLAPSAECGAHEPAGKALLGHHPTPGAIAEAVVWLAENPFVTGQTIFVDSGQHLL